ncbi:hypothetical protein [Fischerella sp.]|jgi:hypothetical protein|uniref:hypothetical protein n=1 Tax=Fischerella sp. TaxID=1191 RepID=UPI0025BDE214|nr:hypothetical protein [Fischerella sp.]
MTPEYEYSRLANAEDIKRLGEILNQCFVGTPGDEEIYINCIGVENFRILHQLSDWFKKPTRRLYYLQFFCGEFYRLPYQ